MQVAEERLNAGFAGQCLMLSELAAVVEGDGMPGGLGQTVEYISQHIAGFRRRFGLQGGRDEEPRHAFAEREQVAPLGASNHLPNGRIPRGFPRLQAGREWSAGLRRADGGA